MSWIKLQLDSSEARVIKAFEGRGAQITEALLEKMTFLMRELQNKIRNEKLSGLPYSQTGALAASIANPRADKEGKKIVGKLDWGGGDAAAYAKLQEYGGIKQSYIINVKDSVGPYHGGVMHGKQIPPHAAIVGKRALSFLWGKTGKREYFENVRHLKVAGKHFMRDSITEMEDTIIRGLQETIIGGF